MSMLVADCPRCGAKRITFDVLHSIFLGVEYQWCHWFEIFSVCRSCDKSTTFIVCQKKSIERDVREKFAPHMLDTEISFLYETKRYLSVKEHVTTTPPEHLPQDVRSIFMEGATCHAIGCYNAAATMFRLCIDMVTKPLLPDENDPSAIQPNKFQRRNLGPRMDWLFDQNRLPTELRDLATCVREDGNDGAHVGNLTKADTEDLIDFTFELLERLISEPKRIELAIERRSKRRSDK